MSSEHDPERAPAESGTGLRRLIHAASKMVGRSVAAEPFGEPPEADSLEPEFDTAETLLANTESPGTERESGGAAANTDANATTDAAANEPAPPRRRPAPRFSIQRAVIFSSTSAGFFENEATQSFLFSKRKEADFPVVPHVTIAQKALVSQIMARRKGIPVNMIASECRQVVDRLPDRRYAHITGAKTMQTNGVMLDLDWKGRGSLLEDVRQLCEHFEIPYTRQRKADYYPHVIIMWTPDTETASHVAGELNELIHDSEPKPTAIGFGIPTVLVDRASS